MVMGLKKAFDSKGRYEECNMPEWLESVDAVKLGHSSNAFLKKSISAVV